MTTGSPPAAYSPVLAQHYDEDYAILRPGDGADVAFYLDLACASGGPVLDVACGTGRVLLPIARKAIPITGVDATPEMLSILSDKLAHEPPLVRESITLRDGRFDALGVNGPYALVFAAFRAFQHLYSRDEQLAALREMARVLAPGGRLAFDLFDFCPERAAAYIHEHVDYVLEDGNTRRERRSSSRLDKETGLLHGRFRWYVDGTPVEEAEFSMRVSTRAEIEALLPEAGLRLEALYGDFDRSPWRADDPRELVFVAARADDPEPAT